MKVLFLDIDGVLNSFDNIRAIFALEKLGKFVQFSDDYGSLFDARCVHWLDWIVLRTDCKIVISSSWRYDGLDKMKSLWKKRSLSGKVIDITPSILTETTLLKYGDEICRGHEIQQWLDENQPQKYCILDDNADMLESQKDFFVQTNPKFGLDEKTARKVASILNKNE